MRNGKKLPVFPFGRKMKTTKVSDSLVLVESLHTSVFLDDESNRECTALVEIWAPRAAEENIITDWCVLSRKMTGRFSVSGLRVKASVCPLQQR